MPLVRTLVLCTSVLMVSGVRPVMGQVTPIVVGEVPAAKMRGIKVVKLFTLDSEQLGLAGNEDISGIARTSGGRFYVSAWNSLTGTDAVLLSLSREGKLIRRLGRTGDGPGEYRYPNWVAIGKGDTVYVTDRNRVILYAGDRAVRTIALPQPATTIDVLDDGSLVGTYNDINTKYRIFNSTGKEVYRAPNDPAANTFGQVVHHHGGKIWLAEANAYRVERRTKVGKPEKAWIRSAPWYDPPDRTGSGTMMLSMRVDREGRLWCFFVDKGSNWKPESPRYDMMVEVTDTKSNRVVARQRFVDGGIAIKHGLLAVKTREDEDGFKNYDIVELMVE